ncbi:MAG: prevent-host-death protein [Proteobacteria bacterium]|nr:prevent-host-death protein [Pseudomonadota bacterium]MBU1736731.1 prevent-host-death protein [Pseudomonadota bacterium]
MSADEALRKRFSKVLDSAKKEEILIKRRSGEVFSLVLKKSSASPFDVSGIHCNAATEDILDAIRDSRSGRK